MREAQRGQRGQGRAEGRKRGRSEERVEEAISMWTAGALTLLASGLKTDDEPGCRTQ